MLLLLEMTMTHLLTQLVGMRSGSLDYKAFRNSGFCMKLEVIANYAHSTAVLIQFIPDFAAGK